MATGQGDEPEREDGHQNDHVNDSASQGQLLLSVTQDCNFTEAASIIESLPSNFPINDFRDENHRTPVHLTACSPDGGDVLLQMLGKFGEGCFTVKDVNDETAIHIAAREQNNSKHSEVLQKLVNETNSFNCMLSKNKQNQMPLHFMMQHQSASFVKQVTDSTNIHLNEITDKSGNTTVHYAAHNDENPGVLHHLVTKSGLNCLLKENKAKHTPLAIMLQHRSGDYVKAVFAGQDQQLNNLFSHKDSMGNTAAHYAAMNERDSDVMEFVTGKQKMDKCLAVQNERKVMPVHLMIQHQSAEIIGTHITSTMLKELLNPKDEDGDTIAHYAARNPHNPSVLEHLVIKGLLTWQNLLAENKKKQTPMHIMMQYQTAKSVRNIMSKGSQNEDVKNNLPKYDLDKKTAAHYAAENEANPGVLHWLIQNLSIKCLAKSDSLNITPLQIIMQNRSLSFVRKLAGKGNSELFVSGDDSGNTAAHYAVRNENNPDLLKFLIDKTNGACLVVLNKKTNETPLQILMQSGSSQLFESVLQSIKQHLTKAGSNGNTAAHYAAECKNYKVLQMIIKQIGIGCLLTENSNKETPLQRLHDNFQEENKDVIDEILNQTDDNGNTLAHLTVRNLNRSSKVLLIVIKLLTDQCLFSKNKTGETALEIMLKTRSAEYFKAIVNEIKFKELISESKSESKSIGFALENDKNSGVLQQVIKHLGVEYLMEIIESEKQTPLGILMQQKTKDFVKEVVISENFSKEQLIQDDKLGNTAAYYAAHNDKNPGVMKLLIAKANFNCLLKGNSTALQIVMSNRSVEFVKEATGDVNSKDLKQPDDNGNTAAHYAASHVDNDVLIYLIKKLSIDCLFVKNTNGKTPIQILMQKQSQEEGKARKSSSDKFIKSFFGKLDPDTQKELLIQTDHEFMVFLIRNLEPDFLKQPINSDQTALQIILQNRSAEFVQKVIECIADKYEDKGEKFLSEPDDKGDTAAHYAAHNTENPDVVIPFIKLLTKSCLDMENNNKQTPLSIFQSLSMFGKMVNSENIEEFATKSSFYWFTRNFDEGVKTLRKVWSQDNPNDDPDVTKSLLSSDDQSKSQFKWRTAIQHAISQNQLEFLSAVCDLFYPSQRIAVTGNSSLHYLFAMDGVFEENELIDKIKEILRKDYCDPKHENELHLTCLQFSRVRCLRQVLESVLKDNEMTDKFKKMLTNSKRLHAVHALAGRYDLEGEHGIAELLARLSDLSVDELLKHTVADGKYKGATCLHFVCMEGHTINFEFLVQNQKEKCTARTEDNKSCFDIAIDNGKRQWLLDIVSKQWWIDLTSKSDLIDVSLLRLIDIPEGALQLPDESRAEKELKAISNVTDSSVSVDSSKTMLYLLRAFENDKPIIIRSLLSLNLLQSDSASEFPKYLQDELNKTGTNALIGKALTQSDLSKSFKKTDLSKNPMTLLSTAAHFERVNIIPDLLLISQFDLIPVSIQLLLQLKPKEQKQEGKYEQLKELQEKVTNIAVNAMEQLFLNADSEQQKLLFRYLTAQMVDGDGSGSSKENSLNGPRFQDMSVLANIEDEDRTKQTEEGKQASAQDAENQNRNSSVQIQNVHLQQSEDCGQNSQTNEISHVSVSVLEMFEELNNEDLLGTECVYKLANEVWAGNHSLNTNRRAEMNGDSTLKIQQFCNFCRSPRTKFILHYLFFAIFLMFFSWFIIDIGRTFQNASAVVILILFAVSYTMQEINEIWNKRKLTRFYFKIFKKTIRLPVYFRDWLNVFDILSLIMMWIGIVWYLNIFSSPSYPCQMILTSSFLLWGFRSLAVLNIFELTGPVISMLRKLLLHDLLPFLVILFVIFFSFGCFFSVLLFPVVTAPAAEASPGYKFDEALKQIFLLPALLLFGLFEKSDYSSACNKSTEQKIGEVAHPVGVAWFNNGFLFVFLLLVNIVMMNLLIALFNLTVSKMSGKAKAIWRQKYLELVRDCENLTIVPPPLSFIEYFYRLLKLLRRKCRSCYNKVADGNEQTTIKWWEDEKKYSDCQEFMQFLQYQAMTFRKERPLLTRSLTTNKADFDQLKASNENGFADVQKQIVGELNEKVEKRMEEVEKRREEVERRLENKIDSIMNYLQQHELPRR